MEQIEKVNLGDIIAMEDNDSKFIDDLMDAPSKMKCAAYDLFGKAIDAEKEAWENFYKAYPMFEGFSVRIHHKDMYISVIGKRER